MPISEAELAQLVDNPSPSATVYQAAALIEELNRINTEEYLPEACTFRDVFLAIGKYVYDELSAIALSPCPDHARARELGRVVQSLYAFIRYLWASAPRQSPPGIQVALAELTNQHFPAAKNGKAVCLVRPQWDYNVTYVPTTWQLREMLKPSVFDPGGTLGNSEDAILEALWQRRIHGLPEEERPTSAPELPKQLAVLSFAGLDTDDTLLYPLLAHELGHFIDFSYTDLLHFVDPIPGCSEIREEDVEVVLNKYSSSKVNLKQISLAHSRLVRLTASCLTEILADLLATRMMGLAFFIALAEFLKSLADWSQPKITEAGYPGTQFRLSIIFKHLTSTSNPLCVRAFFTAHREGNEEICEALSRFIDAWEQRLSASVSGAAPLVGLPAELNALVVKAVEKTLPELERVAATAIPDVQCATLTPQFFERIKLLDSSLPPSCSSEDGNSFSEIASAAWAYQMLKGEDRESRASDRDGRLSEYRRTCRLVLKAIELIPPLRQPAKNGEVARVEIPFPGGTPPELALASPGALSGPEICRRTSLPVGDKNRISIIPFKRSAIQAASLDVHLGHWFAVAKRTRLRSVRLGKKADERLLMTVGREEVFIPTDHPFLIHPGDFILGATQEFIALPPDVMAFVEGKSSLGRKGLIVATATQVAPGFHGVVVLEMANTGTVPLEVYPESLIAQLVLLGMSRALPDELLYRGRYNCQVKP